jgi:hypothetical protein
MVICGLRQGLASACVSFLEVWRFCGRYRIGHFGAYKGKDLAVHFPDQERLPCAMMKPGLDAEKSRSCGMARK